MTLPPVCVVGRPLDRSVNPPACCSLPSLLSHSPGPCPRSVENVLPRFCSFTPSLLCGHLGSSASTEETASLCPCTSQSAVFVKRPESEAACSSWAQRLARGSSAGTRPRDPAPAASRSGEPGAALEAQRSRWARRRNTQPWPHAWLTRVTTCTLDGCLDGFTSAVLPGVIGAVATCRRTGGGMRGPRG